jgi:hypothetical protein
MNRDELLEIFGGGRREILKTLKERDRFLLNTDTGEICRVLEEIVRNPGTMHIKLDGPQTPLEWKNWERRADRNKMFVDGKPVYWIEIGHDNGRIYDHYEPVKWLDLEPGEEVWIDNVAANPQAPVPVTGPWIVVNYHKLFSIKNNSTISYQADNLVRKK